MRRLLQLLFLFLFFDIATGFQQSLQIKFYSPKAEVKFINYMIKRPKIALVLSGGGARGLSHIGVLKVIERYNIPIDCIVGTSMGSIVGGLYCAGLKAEELEKVATKTDWKNILNLGEKGNRADLFLDKKYLIEKSFIYFRFKGFRPQLPYYIVSGHNITESLLKIFLKAPFHYVTDYRELEPNFYAVATDLASGKRIIFSNGNLVYSIKASSTVPLVFQPVFMDSLVLVDGGLISNIPVDVARELGCDIVIAVDATSPLRSPSEIELPWNTADQIISIMMQLSNKSQLENSDIVLKPNLEDITASDFEKADLIIKRGEEIANQKIDEIIALLDAKTKIISDGEVRRFANYKVKILGDGLPAEGIFLISNKDTITDVEIAHFLFEVLSHEEYKDIVVEVYEKLNPEIVIWTSLNPEIRKINVYPQSMHNFEIDLNEFPKSMFCRIEQNDSCFVFYPRKELFLSKKNSREILREILLIFHTLGFPFVKVRDVKFDTLKQEFNVYLSDGYVSEMKITGNKKTKDFIILRDVKFKVNEVLTESKVMETLRNLWVTNLFSQVRIDYKVYDSVKVIIDLQESASQFLRLGMRIDNERGGQIFLDFRNENTFGLSDDLGITFQGGMRNSLLKFEYRFDRLFKTMLTYRFNLYHSKRRVHTYSRIFNDRRFYIKNDGEIEFSYAGLEISTGGQFERLGNTLLKYQKERADVRNVSRLDFKSGKNSLAKLQLNINVDSRDKPYFPNRGVYMTAYYEISQKFIGSDVVYSKIFFSYENYNTYFRYGVLKFKFLFGLCDESTPLSQQFFIGSVSALNSFSGMREDELYGRQVILSGIEARFRNPVKVGFESFISVRYDMGSTWEKFEAIRLKDLRHGFGVEFGFDTFVGALRIIFGRSFVLKKARYRDIVWGPNVFHFSLGFE